MDASSESDRVPEPTDEEVVETAAEAAESVVLAAYKQSRITDMDVTVRFEEGLLDVDVYVNVPTNGDSDADPDEVAEEAVRAATEAVDDLFADHGSGEIG